MSQRPRNAGSPEGADRRADPSPTALLQQEVDRALATFDATLRGRSATGVEARELIREATEKLARQLENLERWSQDRDVPIYGHGRLGEIIGTTGETYQIVVAIERALENGQSLQGTGDWVFNSGTGVEEWRGVSGLSDEQLRRASLGLLPSPSVESALRKEYVARLQRLQQASQAERIKTAHQTMHLSLSEAARRTRIPSETLRRLRSKIERGVL